LPKTVLPNVSHFLLFSCFLASPSWTPPLISLKRVLRPHHSFYPTLPFEKSPFSLLKHIPNPRLNISQIPFYTSHDSLLKYSLLLS
jgi:hypothetical protein